MINIAESSLTKSGLRATYSVQLEDGRVIKYGPIDVANSSEAETKKSQIEALVVSNTQKQDAVSAVNSGIYTAHGLATDAMVQYEWLLQAFSEPELCDAYLKMKNIAPSILALGLTDEQYSVLLNTTVEEAVTAKNYWLFLSANSAAIEAYITVRESFN